jgi:hypothetical protein
MASGIAETTAEAKPPQSQTRPRRRAPAAEPDGAKPRFFLAREGKTGREPAFEREFAGEAEVLVESLKTGRNFYVLYEYRSMADCSGKAPQIRKEGVS